MYRYLILFFLFVCPIAIFANSEPNRIHPDEPAKYTEDVRFSIENALNSLKEIEKSLISFQKLTDTIRSKKVISLNRFAYTDWEMQNLGFPNMVIAIEGALHKQNYLINKTKYELACEKRKNISITEEEFGRALYEYQESKKKYEKFWSDTVIAD